MPVKVGKVEMYMGPSNVGGPDDLENAIIDFINGAQKKLDIAVQELDNWKIAKAIINARKRGVTTRLVLELDYLRSKKPQVDPYQPGGKLKANRDIHDSILRTAIKVNSDFNTNIFHQKFIVRDSNALLTGSTNFTDTGTSTNLNHLIIIHDQEVAKIYSREFKEISQGRFGRYSMEHGEKPKEGLEVSNLAVKVLFAPDHNPEMEIMKQMAKAKKRIDFAIFTFSKSSGIDDQMIMLRKAGIPIRGAMDIQAANQVWSAKLPLRDGKIKLYEIAPQKPLRKLHHKLIVIDKQLVIGGSFNFTGPANLLNDENIIIVGDLDSQNQTSITAQKKFAKYAFDEIERIINTYGKKIS